MSRHIIAIFIAALVYLMVTACRRQPDTGIPDEAPGEVCWAAMVDHGDKPGIGYVIRSSGGKWSGRVYLLDPESPVFKKEYSAPMLDVVFDGKTWKHAVVFRSVRTDEILTFPSGLEGNHLKAIVRCPDSDVESSIEFSRCSTFRAAGGWRKS